MMLKSHSLQSPLFALAFLLLTPALSAQFVGGEWRSEYQFDGDTANDHFGHSVAPIGDINSDGFDDLILGAPKAGPGSQFGSGSVYLFSGKTGLILQRLDGVAVGDEFGFSVAALEDIDNDQVPDLAVGAPMASPPGLNQAGIVYLYSGATASLIREIPGTTDDEHFGYAVIGTADLDSDTTPDLLVGAPDRSTGVVENGSVVYVSAASGATIRTIDGAAGGDRLGAALLDAGDQDGDLVPDHLLAAPTADPGLMPDAGQVLLYSGDTGAFIRSYDGLADGDLFGSSLANILDLDTDNSDDFMIGAPGADPGGRSEAGSVFVISGNTGAEIRRLDGAIDGDAFGSSVALAGDVTGNGIDEWLVGAPLADDSRPDRGAAYLYDSTNGTIIREFRGPHRFARFGFAVSRGGDINGDGREDMVIGAPTSKPGGLVDQGLATVQSFDPFLSADGDVLSNVAGGTINFQLDFPNSEASQSYVLLTSLTGTGPTSIAGGTLEVPLSPDVLYKKAIKCQHPAGFVTPCGSLDGSGDGVAALVVPPNKLGPYVGSIAYFAAVSFEPKVAARRSSAAVAVRIEP